MPKGLQVQIERKRSETPITVHENRRARRAETGYMTAMANDYAPAPIVRRNFWGTARATVEPVARYTREEFQMNASIARRNMYHQLLSGMCGYCDGKIAAGEFSADANPGFLPAAEAVKRYASLNLETAKEADVRKAFTDAQKALAQYAPGQGGPAGISGEDQMIREYQMHFSKIAQGSLMEDQDLLDGGKALRLDRTREEPPLRRGLSWKDMSEEPLFVHEPCMEDVGQGALGDCYFLAAIASLSSRRPEIIKEMMRDNGDGTVTVRLYDFEREEVYGAEQLPPEEYDFMNREDLSGLSDEELMYRMLSYYPESIRPESMEIFGEIGNIYIQKRDSMIEQFREQDAQGMADAQETADAQEMADTQETADAQMTQEERERQRKQRARAIQEEYEKILPVNNPAKYRKIRAVASMLANDADYMEILNAAKASATTAGGTLPKKEFLKAAHRHIAAMDIERCRQITGRTGEIFESMRAGSGSQLKLELYLTVTKKVPVTGRGNDAYARDCLWVQLLEKALALASIRRTDEEKPKIKDMLEQIKRDLQRDPGWRTAQPEELEKEAKRRMQYSYENLEGGDSGKAACYLCGAMPEPFEEVRESDTGKTLAKNKDYGKGLKDGIAALMQAGGTDTAQARQMLDILIPGLTEELIRRHYIQSDDYSERALTIEDFTEALLSIRSWQNRSVYRTLKTEFPGLSDDALMQKISEVSQFTEQYFSGQDNSKVQFRSFGDGARYTASADRFFRELHDALSGDWFITCGAQAYIPEGRSASRGLNGEPISGGVAERHAYVVLGCFEEEGTGRRFVTIKNPWNCQSHLYDKVTDASTGEVTYEVRSARDTEEDVSGTFNVELNDFLARMGHCKKNRTSVLYH